MTLWIRPLILSWALLALGLSFRSGRAYAEKEDYLTDEEIEQLREAQEPPQRIKLLSELLEKRLEKAQELKDPAAIKPKPAETERTKKKSSSRKKDETPEAKPSRRSEPSPPRTFADWMNEYLQCLEEISNNVENFSSVPMDAKAYLKSLNKLSETLEENGRWIEQIESSLERSDRKVLEEVAEVRQELAEDVQAATEKTQEQIKLLKEAQKAKSSRK
jgi:hypothetical protein